ncbi:glycosyltransferase family 4 protein [Reinekea sp.]|jgi:mannosyltransferase|uniref:glycosyltransferase family 4 protein n=1 Tax=Reinekea sp. TaxID=1970455 RepID=UPI003988F90A
MKIADDTQEVEFILGNSNRRFSGVTSTMLQVLHEMSKSTPVAVFGKHHLPKGALVWGWREIIVRCRSPLRSGKYRVFHARRNNEMLQALVLKRVFRCKFKIVFTSTAQRKKTWITRFLMSKMDGLISTCSAAASYMPTRPDIIIAHGIDTAFFTDLPLNKSKPLALPGKFNIGMFGRVREQKGVDLLVDAALSLLPANPEWGVVIVGEITTEQTAFHKSLIEKLRERGLESRVLFTDKVDFSELPFYFNAIDIAVALSRNEGFGLTVLEALALSKPVVATRAGAWPDIITSDELGRLIDVGDLAALVTSLQELMSNEYLRRAMGIAGKNLVLKGYTVEREAASLLGFYRSMQLLNN